MLVHCSKLTEEEKKERGKEKKKKGKKRLAVAS